MRVMLPKPMTHVKTALELRHQRDVVKQMHGSGCPPKRFRNFMGSGLQTEVRHAKGATLVRTYADGYSEAFEQEK